MTIETKIKNVLGEQALTIIALQHKIEELESELNNKKVK